jgi:2'-5' RNA ligase
VRDETGELNALRQSIAEAVVPFEERHETKPFTPHLTLARVAPPSQAVGRLLAPLALELLEVCFGTWDVEHVVLYQTLPGGEHSALGRFPWQRPRPARRRPKSAAVGRSIR